jgi:hypothetical protein
VCVCGCVLVEEGREETRAAEEECGGHFFLFFAPVSVCVGGCVSEDGVSE